MKIVLQVFLVAGGWDGSSSLSSTEMLVGEDSKAWIMGKPLPFPRSGLRGVTIENRLLFTGIKLGMH